LSNRGGGEGVGNSIKEKKKTDNLDGKLEYQGELGVE